VQVGYPLQYNQRPLLRTLWTAGFLAQMLLHKVAPWLVSAPLFILVQDPSMRYRDVLAATQRSRAVVSAIAAGLVGILIAVAARALPRVIAAISTGGAAAAA
jgi:hypothetical protein